MQVVLLNTSVFDFDPIKKNSTSAFFAIEQDWAFAHFWVILSCLADSLSCPPKWPK